MLQPGQVIANRYLLDSPIGEGAMGAVWRAEDQTLKRQVAIKFLFVKATRDPQGMVDQFLREARIAASVQHRNVIQTVDFGTVDQWQPFMVMELLSGESLGDRLAREPPLSREQTIHIVSLTLRGLAAVHDAGIVHRDLKPQNIFLQRDADAVYPKILDFGISRTLEHKGERPSAIATQEGMIVGTPDYMSPEQARGEGNIDKRSDIYSMAVIVYEGLTGQLPFDAETIGDLIVKIMTQEPPTMREVVPDIPQSLSDMVAQAMSKKREHRFADARAMRRALLAAAESALGRRISGGSMPPPDPAPPEALFPGAAPPPPSPIAGLGLGPARPAGPPPAQNQAPGPASRALQPQFGVPAAAARGVTWGDFEGLNAPQILDSGAPPEDGAPAGPKPQRIVARLSDQIISTAPPAQQSERAASGDPASAGARKGKKPPRKPAAGSGATLEDGLDPLYAGVGQAAPEIDYERVRSAGRKSAPLSAQGLPRTRPLAQQREPKKSAARPRVRYKSKLGAYALPIVAVALFAYAWTRPALESGRGGALAHASARSAPSTPAGSEPNANRQNGPAEAPGGATGPASAGRSTADSGLKQIRIGTRGRRDNPGQAPPHLRDVNF